MSIVRIKNRATARYLRKLDSSIRNVIAKMGMYPNPICLVLMTVFCEMAKAGGKEKRHCHSLLDDVWDNTVKVEILADLGDLADTKVEIDN
jgi:hypothetical protein